jgi:acyl carrier protein
MKNKILTIVIDVAREMGQEIESRELQNAQSSTRLYGQNGILDSLGLVRFIGEVEEQISDKLEKDISIASERAMSRRNSPFQDIDSLSNYIVDILTEYKDA